VTVNKIRRNGSYAPLSAHYYKDDAIDEAGEAAELLYVRGLAFCADVLSDGFISDRQLVRFVGVGMFDAIDRAVKLVEVGLWESTEGGYRVRSWLDWNRSRAEITDVMAKDRERKTRSGPSADSDRPEPDPPNGGGQDADRIPNGIPTDSKPAAEGSPNGIHPRARTPLHSTTDTKKTSATADAVAQRRARFNDFWLLYPRRVKKQDAVKVWDTHVVKAKVDPDDVLAALRAQISRWQAERKEIQYIPHPPVWLRGGRWADEPEQALLTLVPDGPVLASFEDYRLNAAGPEAAKLIGIGYVPRSQPPSDNTPPLRWAATVAVEWIDEHERQIRTALTEQRNAG
jgi:hypothetical protein